MSDEILSGFLDAGKSEEELSEVDIESLGLDSDGGEEVEEVL